MSIVSYASKRISTTANTTVTPVSIAGARLYASTSAAIVVHLHDTSGTTSASTRVATLSTKAIGAIDQLLLPIRFYSGTCIVTPTSTSGQLYLQVR